MFPSDDILIARGKYATLGSERRALLKRIQSSCSLLVSEASQIMREAEKEHPDNPDFVTAAYTLLDTAKAAREELVKVCAAREEVKDLSWGKKDTPED